MKVRFGLAVIGAAMFAGTALAGGSTIYGNDLRGGRFFSTTTDNFVGGFSNLGASTANGYALDFDASATTLWGARTNDAGLTFEYGTFDLSNGTFTVAGFMNGIATGDSVTGLTASGNGNTWYFSTYNATTLTSQLYVGDITTGNFSAVGSIGAGIIIDIAMDSQGNLYGTGLDDNLYSIDTGTGAGTIIGAMGFDINFAQGMDFDWSTDTLYATMYQGGGVGQFASIDVNTGLATSLELTTSLNMEAEMAVQQAIPAPGAIALLGLAGLAARRRRRA